jgi:hypothetical protein
VTSATFPSAHRAFPPELDTPPAEACWAARERITEEAEDIMEGEGWEWSWKRD